MRSDSQFRRWDRGVRNVDELTIKNGGASDVLASERDRKPASKRFDASGVGGGDRRRIDFLPIRQQDDDRSARKEPQPALGTIGQVEYRLGIIERIVDDTEYTRGRRLLLQRLGQIVRALA